MKRYRVDQVDALTTELFRGNPAGVVREADGLPEAQMQAIARELNNHMRCHTSGARDIIR